ncbi:MAG: 30S ribosomal protein S16 [Parcubacteria group bacterium GW2011_GWD1_40_9]|nr:MAG: 30S ribosomal protein S16 [Parcubacteria group bacterium GW2011_GWD1_40_9]
MTIWFYSVSIATMLKIRLQRVGRKHEPTFRLVLTDSKNSTKSGRYLENLGSYDSRHGEASNFKADKISEWISKGAQVSGTVHNILISKKIITGKKVNVLPLKKAILKEAVEEPKASPAVAEESASLESPAEPVVLDETPAEAVSEEAPTPVAEKIEA